MEEIDIGQQLNTLREEEYLCDVILRVENRKFPCHRVVLASRCTYFYAMFRSFKEKTSAEVNLGGLSSNGFEDLLKYIYENNVSINKDNFKNLIIASDMLGIEKLQASCIQFIEDDSGPNMLSDIFDLFIFADFHNYAKLGGTLKRFICEKFSDICDSDSVTNLNYEQLKSILESKDLTAEKEETVFNGLLKWIKFDKEGRSKYMEELLSLIKVPSLMSPYMIGLMLNEPIIKNDQKYVEMVVKRSVSSLYKTYKKPKLEFQEPRFMLLSRDRFDDDDFSNIVEPQIFQKNRFVQNFEEISVESIFVRGVVLNKNMLFVLSVQDDEGMEFQKIDLDSGESMSLKPPPIYMNDFSLRTDGSRIYLNNHEPDHELNHQGTNFLVYDLHLDIWIEIPELKINNEQIVNSCFNVHKNELFSIGGRIDYGNVINDVFAFDIRGNNWRALPPMTKPRYRSGACFDDKNLYVCGGICPSHNTNERNHGNCSMEVFDFSSNKWRLSNFFPEKRFDHSMFCVNNKLYVIGGNDDNDIYVTTVSDFDVAFVRSEDLRASTEADRIKSYRIDKGLWRTTQTERFEIMDAILLGN